MVITREARTDENIYGNIGLSLFGFFTDATISSMRFALNKPDTKRVFDGVDLGNIIKVMRDRMRWPDLFPLTLEALQSPEYRAETLFEIDYSDKNLSIHDVVSTLKAFFEDTEAQLKDSANA